MADLEDRQSPDDDSPGRIWRGLRALLFGDSDEVSLRAQLEGVIDEHELETLNGHEGARRAVDDLTSLERQMLRNMLHFGEASADDVAVLRADIVAVPASSSFEQIVAAFIDAGHSRLPVYQDSLDRIIGMLHVKDVFALLVEEGRSGSPDWREILRQPLYVPVSMGLLDLLAEMRAKRTHLAIVVDEYSGTEGLVTIEDLVEEIVGEIEDEHDDEPEPELVARDGGIWDADARVELETVCEQVSRQLGRTGEDVHTLGGLAVMLAEDVPERGAILTHPSGWRIEVLDRETRRLRRLRLHPPIQPETDEGD